MKIQHLNLPDNLAEQIINLMQPVDPDRIGTPVLPYLRSWTNRHLIPLDVRETSDSYEIDAALPAGASKANTTLKVQEDVVTVAVKFSAETTEKQPKYLMREIAQTDCQRRFEVPADGAADSIKAEFADGILRIKIAKRKTTSADKEIVIE